MEAFNLVHSFHFKLFDLAYQRHDDSRGEGLSMSSDVSKSHDRWQTHTSLIFTNEIYQCRQCSSIHNQLGELQEMAGKYTFPPEHTCPCVSEFENVARSR